MCCPCEQETNLPFTTIIAHVTPLLHDLSSLWTIKFRELNRRYPMVLFPAFRLQDRMQKVTFGQVRVCERGVPQLCARGFTERSGGVAEEGDEILTTFNLKCDAVHLCLI